MNIQKQTETDKNDYTSIFKAFSHTYTLTGKLTKANTHRDQPIQRNVRQTARQR